MPITQDRVLKLLAAARDYQAALRQACQAVQDHFQDCDRGHESAESAMLMLSVRLKERLLLSDIGSVSVIEVEARYFQSAKTRNESAARRQRRRRAAARGLEPEPEDQVRERRVPSLAERAMSGQSREGQIRLPAVGSSQASKIDDFTKDPDYNWGRDGISAEGVGESAEGGAGQSPVEPAQSDLDLMNQFADERAEQIKIIKPEQS